MSRWIRVAALGSPCILALMALVWRESTRPSSIPDVPAQVPPPARALLEVADLGHFFGVQSVQAGTWQVLGQASVARFRRSKEAWREFTVVGRFRTDVGHSELELTLPGLAAGEALPQGAAQVLRWSSAQAPRPHPKIAGVWESLFDGGSLHWMLGPKRRMVLQGVLHAPQTMGLELALDLVLHPDSAPQDG